MASDEVTDAELREAQREYLDFLDDDVSLNSRLKHVGTKDPWVYT